MLKKYSNLDNMKLDYKSHQQQVERLEIEIRTLIEENNELNELVHQQLQNEGLISELEEQYIILIK